MDIDLGRVVDALPGLVCITRGDGEGEFVNRRWRDYTGLSGDQARDRGWQAALHPDDLAPILNAWDLIRRSGADGEVEGRLRRADGEYGWILFRLSPVDDDGGGDPAWCWLGSEIDESAAGAEAAEPDRRLRRFLLRDLRQAEALLAGEVQVLEMVASGRPLLEVLDALSRLVEEICSGCLCSILIVTPDRQRFRVGAGPSLPAAYNQILDGKTIDGGYGPCSLAVLAKRPILTPDLARDPRWAGSVWPELMKSYGYASCWSMPILAGSGEASGIFAIYRHDPVSPTPEEQELVDRFTKIAGIAINRAQADDALQQSEQRLRRAHAQLSEGQRLSKTASFTSDLRMDRHEWSDEYYRIFEFPTDAPPSIRMVRERVHPDDRAMFDREIERAIDGGGADFTFRIVTPGAGLKHLRGLARVVEHVEGRPIFMGTVQDVTEAKLAETALTASEAELRRANMQLTDAHRLSRTGSFTWDVLADSHTWTEEIFRLFEFDPQSKVDMQMMLDEIHPEDLPAVQNLLGHALDGADFDLVFRVVPRSGVVKYARVVGRRIAHIVDRPVFMGALQDVTASKVAEEALNRARSELAHVARITTLSALTASIAHEVSQPLAGILNNANTCLRMLAAEPPNYEGAAATARRTIRDADRATEVIKRLRALFARKAPTSEIVDLNAAAREVLALSSSELQRARVVLQTQFAAGSALVRGDRVQLQQVILNLLINAADAMADVAHRPRTLVIGTEVHDAQARLFVRDVGVGVDPQALERLFDAFYTTKPEGMGVGLSISRSIVESHDGRLWAAPNEGPGATFSFALPMSVEAQVRTEQAVSGLGPAASPMPRTAS